MLRFHFAYDFVINYLQVCLNKLRLFWPWEDNPKQLLPPYAGEGFEHVLVLVCVPPSQDSEQVDQEEYKLHPPLTEHNIYSGKYLFFLQVNDIVRIDDNRHKWSPKATV